jgi:hypothetical protein
VTVFDVGIEASKRGFSTHDADFTRILEAEESTHHFMGDAAKAAM